MDNLEDRVDICKAIIGTDGGDNFMFHLLDSWPASLGELRLIETLDWFLTSPVETLMWDAQTRQQDFASAWLRLLCSALMQPEPLPAQALGNTLQIAGAFQEVLVKEAVCSSSWSQTW
ncbi:unnamed protein product [Effrenium voratum]|nr:unnamed protein product [Effrenium voratum]